MCHRASGRRLSSQVPIPGPSPCLRHGPTGQAVGFPLSAQWKESLSLLCDEIADCAATSALCLQAGRCQSAPSFIQGSAFDSDYAEADGKLPTAGPHSGCLRPARSRWSGHSGFARPFLAGHLGQQQWSEVKSWLLTEASQTCDVLVLQETHWQATAEFTASGWYCVSSASPDDTLKAKKSKKGRGGTAHTVKEAEAQPESSQDQTQSGPSVASRRGHGSHVPTRSSQERPVERTRRRPGLGSPIRLAGRSGHCSCSLSACLVTSQDSAQQQAGSCLSTEGAGPLHQTRATPGHLDPGR